MSNPKPKTVHISQDQHDHLRMRSVHNQSNIADTLAEVIDKGLKKGKS